MSKITLICFVWWNLLRRNKGQFWTCRTNDCRTNNNYVSNKYC